MKNIYSGRVWTNKFAGRAENIGPVDFSILNRLLELMVKPIDGKIQWWENLSIKWRSANDQNVKQNFGDKAVQQSVKA